MIEVETVSTRYGSLQLLPDDKIVCESYRMYGEWAGLELERLLRFIQLGDTVLDAGAFIGGHTLGFAKKCGVSGAVLSFEPRQVVFEHLVANASLNDLSWVSSYCLAVSNRSGPLRGGVGESPFNQGGFSLLEAESEVNRAYETVNAVRVDSLGLSKLDFLKLDIEGMEYAALQGARSTLESCRPIVFAECNALQNSYPILDFSKEMGYEMFGVISPAYNSGNFKQNRNNVFGDSSEVGLLLIPSEKRSKHEEAISFSSAVELKTLDDLALLLMHKSQYHSEVLRRSQVAKELGTRFETDLTGDLRAAGAQILQRLYPSTQGGFNASGNARRGPHPAELQSQLEHEILMARESAFSQENEFRLLREQGERDQVALQNSTLEVAELEKHVQRLKVSATENHRQIEHLKDSMYSKDLEVSALTNDIQELKGYLEMIQNSKSMKITQPLREMARLMNKYLKGIN